MPSAANKNSVSATACGRILLPCRSVSYTHLDVYKRQASGRLTLASVVSVVVALQLGAFSVVLETLASGITALPFSSFVLLMQPIHLAIGIVEGLVTGAVLSFVWKKMCIRDSRRTGWTAWQ